MSNIKPMRDGQCPKCGAAVTGAVVGGLCPNCLVMVSFDTSEDDTLAGLATEAEKVNPQAKVLLSSNIRYFGDYELLEEIARGGMGVVYKARQKSLNRTVAVKMMRGGSTASASEVKRFRVEAEAAANLQHPIIVAIHEVGEHEGQNYFSMDLVEGKNLADYVRNNPLSERQAAQLLKTVAEAVHYAHQRGILHRDLKPQNILMDAGGQPRITDFGLAKRLEQVSTLTVTGEVMGSPGYMPPEQAAGQVAQLGPASDVYALGAILYFLLTGRAPHVGTSPVETLRLAMETEPTPPRQLKAGISADLETICLKCLEKTPDRRYATARNLVEELDRFLKHEPILARPAGRIRTAWKWAARHPWLVTGGLSLTLLGLVGFAYGLWEQVEFLQWQRLHPASKSPYQIDDFFPQWLLSLLVIEFLCFQMLPLALYLRARTHGTLTRRGINWFMALGTGQIGLGVVLLTRGMAANVWAKDAYGELFLLIPVPALTNVWFGGVLVWQSLRELRQTVLGGDVRAGKAVRLLRIKSQRAFAIICAAMLVLSLVMSGWAHRGTGALVLPYVVSVFAVALTILFTGAFRRSRGIEASVYVPPLICSVILSFQLAKQPAFHISAGAFFFGFIGGLLLLDIAKLEGEILPPKIPIFRRLRKLLVNDWRRLVNAAALGMVGFVLLLLVEHGRGRWALARWRTVMERRGEVFDLGQLLPPRIPASQDFEAQLKRAFSNLIDKRISLGTEMGIIETLPGFARRGSQSNNVPITFAQKDEEISWAALEAKIAASDGVLSELRRLMQNPPASRGLVAANLLDPKRPFPNFVAIRISAQTLKASALAQLHHGNHAAALDDLLAIAGIAGLYRDDPTLVNQMIRVAIIGLGTDILWDAIQANGWNDAQLQQLQQAWSSPEVLPQLARSFEVERAERRDAVARFAQMSYGAWGRDYAEVLQGFGAKLPGEYSFAPFYYWRACIFHPIWRTAWARQEELHYLQTLQVDIEIMRNGIKDPSAKSMQRQLAARREQYQAPFAHWRFYNRLPLVEQMSQIIVPPSKNVAPAPVPTPSQPPSASNPSATNVAPAQLPQPISPQPVALEPTYQLPLVGGWGTRETSTGRNKSEYPFPIFDRAWETAFRNLTLRNMAVTAIALKRYELRHGRPAPNLATLIPEFLDKLPVDLMDGQTLRYHFTADGRWILYSVGDDGRDDGGDAQPASNPYSTYLTSGRDMVWPRLAPPG